MMSDAGAHLALDALSNPWFSVHSAYSLSGANEVSAARVQSGIAAAAGRQRTLPAQKTVTVNADQIGRWVGYWSAQTSGTFLGMTPLGGDPKRFAVDLAADRIILASHGLVNGDQVTLFGGTSPAGTTEGALYYVVNATAGDFQVSASLGGAAINLTDAGSSECLVSKVVPASAGPGQQFTVTLNAFAVKVPR